MEMVGEQPPRPPIHRPNQCRLVPDSVGILSSCRDVVGAQQTCQNRHVESDRGQAPGDIRFEAPDERGAASPCRGSSPTAPRSSQWPNPPGETTGELLPNPALHTPFPPRARRRLESGRQPSSTAQFSTGFKCSVFTRRRHVMTSDVGPLSCWLDGMAARVGSGRRELVAMQMTSLGSRDKHLIQPRTVLGQKPRRLSCREKSLGLESA